MAEEPLVRVRGGPKGVRYISLDQWKDEIKGRRGKNPAKKKSPREQRMERKQRRRNESRARKRKKP